MGFAVVCHSQAVLQNPTAAMGSWGECKAVCQQKPASETLLQDAKTGWVSCGRLYLDTIPEIVPECHDLADSASILSWPPGLEVNTGALISLAGRAGFLLLRCAQ